jgi:hypothetical protein
MLAAVQAVEVRPATASPSITKDVFRLCSAASVINGYRWLQSWPPLVHSRTVLPGR